MIFDQTNFYSKIYRRKYIRNKSFHRDVYLNGCYQFPFLHTLLAYNTLLRANCLSYADETE